MMRLTLPSTAPPYSMNAALTSGGGYAFGGQVSCPATSARGAGAPASERRAEGRAGGRTRRPFEDHAEEELRTQHVEDRGLPRRRYGVAGAQVTGLLVRPDHGLGDADGEHRDQGGEPGQCSGTQPRAEGPMAPGRGER